MTPRRRALSALLVYMILAAQFESFLDPLIITAVLPVGVGGAVLTAMLLACRDLRADDWDPDTLDRLIQVQRACLDFRRDRLDIAEDVVERAARAAFAHDFIEELPRGYDTMLGKWFEAGEELSFDYKWDRKRGRAPTKCHCLSPTCRGTLEVPKSMVGGSGTINTWVESKRK